MIFRIALAGVLWVCLEVHATDGTETASGSNDFSLPVAMQLDDARVDRVMEPVFGGRVFIYQAGIRHESTIIFVHGMGEAGVFDWRNLIPLAAKRFHVIAFDLPGFGRSDKGNELYSPRNYARVVEWVRKHYAKNRIILVGHSMGGAISLYYAGRYPDRVEKLILFDVAAVLHRVAYSKHLVGNVGANLDYQLDVIEAQQKKLGRWVGSLMEDADKWGRFAGRLLHEPIFRERLFRGDPSVIASFALADTDFSGVVGNITAPTHIFWGENDTVAPLRTGKVLQAVLNNAALTIIDDTTHVPMNERPSIVAPLFSDALLDESAPNRFELPQSPIAGEIRLIQCGSNTPKVVTGSYDHLSIVDCDNVSLRNLSARKVTITRSVVEIEDSVISGDEVGLVLEHSHVVVTRMSVSARTGVEILNSRIDLAAVRLHGTQNLIRATGDNVIVCSFCRVEQRDQIAMKHGVYRVNKNTLAHFMSNDVDSAPLALFGDSNYVGRKNRDGGVR